MNELLELSIVMPCLDEAETIAVCIEKALSYLKNNQIVGEVLVADNGSKDGSIEIAQKMGARVVNITSKGYGSALLGGIEAAYGEYIIMGDADDSYDFINLNPFVERLRSGYDLVMGNRFKGGIRPGAMPKLHRYLGNQVLTFIGKLFFNSPCGDFHCGLRGFNKRAIERLNLRTTGMEFASEMVVKATLYDLCITEVPTILSPDGRSRPPHLRSWRDGWRHLRFLLLYSPRWLFLYPGLLLILAGLISTLILLNGSKVHSLLYSATAVVIGFQIVIFAVFTKTYAIDEGLMPQDPKLKKILRFFNLETGLIFAVVLLFLGVIGSIYAFKIWQGALFGYLDPANVMKVVIPSFTCLALGVQLFFSSLFLSVLNLKLKS